MNTMAAATHQMVAERAVREEGHFPPPALPDRVLLQRQIRAGQAVVFVLRQLRVAQHLGRGRLLLLHVLLHHHDDVVEAPRLHQDRCGRRSVRPSPQAGTRVTPC